MPESLESGSGRAQVGYGVPPFNAVEPRASLGLVPRWDLDLNLLLLGISKDEVNTVMGGTGLHFRVVEYRFFRLSLSGGLAIGRGGERYDRDAKEYFRSNFAAAYFAGGDLGFRIHRYFGIYLGNRYHVSWASGVPVTQWGYHALGVEINWTSYLYTTLESGVFYYWNRKDSGGGPTCIYLVPVGYRWGKRK